MGFFSHEASLRAAERVINTLIDTVNRNGGGVFLTTKGAEGLSVKLTGHIGIQYFLPWETREDKEVDGR